jgi:hypothetical protein
MTSTYTQVEAALFALLATALATVTGAPVLELDEPRLADPAEVDDAGDVENRFRAVLMPGRIDRSEQQLVNPPPWQLVTTFRVGLHGLGSKDAERRALVRAMASALATAIDTDFTLDGAASYATTESLDTDTAKEAGFAPENLLDLQIKVEWDSPTSAG